MWESSNQWQIDKILDYRLGNLSCQPSTKSGIPVFHNFLWETDISTGKARTLFKVREHKTWQKGWVKETRKQYTYRMIPWIKKWLGRQKNRILPTAGGKVKNARNHGQIEARDETKGIKSVIWSIFYYRVRRVYYIPSYLLRKVTFLIMKNNLYSTVVTML